MKSSWIGQRWYDWTMEKNLERRLTEAHWLVSWQVAEPTSPVHNTCWNSYLHKHIQRNIITLNRHVCSYKIPQTLLGMYFVGRTLSIIIIWKNGHMYLIRNGEVSLVLEQQLNYYQTAILAGLVKCCAAILYKGIVALRSIQNSTCCITIFGYDIFDKAGISAQCTCIHAPLLSCNQNIKV